MTLIERYGEIFESMGIMKIGTKNPSEFQRQGGSWNQRAVLRDECALYSLVKRRNGPSSTQASSEERFKKSCKILLKPPLQSDAEFLNQSLAESPLASHSPTF